MKVRFLALAVLYALPLCAAEEKAARVANPVKEADLSTVKLTPEAERRLAITTAPVGRKKVARTRTFGGEAIVPARAGGTQSIISLLPNLTATDLIRIAEAQIDADGLIAQAKVAHEAARVAFERAEQLWKTKAGSERAVDETRALLAQAAVGLQTAETKRALLAAPVLDVLNPKTLWVRVPVYVGDLPRLAVDAGVSVGGLTGRAGGTKAAKPVAAPPSANAAAATVDLFYEMPNDDGAARLGQKLGVAIPLREPEESLVVPASAVAYDIHGGAWVYERIGEQTYARRRVQVRAVMEADAVLDTGPAPGVQVARTGVAELFGTEFGVGK